MHFLAAAILTLATAANALKIPSFAPPDFPVSDIDNDGTHAGRYDVRKTMVWLDDKNPENLNRGRTTGIFRVEDLQDLSSTGATVFAPGTGSSEYLNLRSEIQNLTSPRGGDNYTAMHVTSDYAGVKLDVHMTPTGKNLYIGGNGGVTLSSPGNDFRELVPGYSWYWGNPTLRLSGTINIDGKDVEIDHGKSRGYFERQSGEFGISGGHWGYWLYLSNGIFIHGWVVGATVERPYSTPAWATVWHPNGIHEVLEVGNTTTATDVWKSPVSGKNYFQNFKLDLPSREASFHIHQAIKKSELRPLPGSDGYQITEAYSQGHGVWEGEKVTFYGHTEQLSYW
ncbi:hypothetical protein AU210_016533 [Fusarium oxysporum f. sp. radicis-cucumerinum]|uniref:AttH domain-containing protein n=1 Tax=Fusarium oxysporum f. sp. radicis-cucumerinum TaxID=327505 RepID=A0A2H3FMW0_FUSOX|nr:hypothetical protein AU210_016533 [Fusarium oxysporum f. sp. radicis-cucumerinum]